MLCLLEKTHLNSLLGPERINAVFTGAARFLLNSEETRNKFDMAPFFDAMNNAGEPRWTDETKSIAGCQEGYLPDECVSPSTRNQQTLPKNRKERWWEGRLKSGGTSEEDEWTRTSGGAEIWEITGAGGKEFVILNGRQRMKSWRRCLASGEG